MTEAMQKAQCREMKRVGKALTPAEQVAILEAVDDEILIAEILERLTSRRLTLSGIEEKLRK